MTELKDMVLFEVFLVAQKIMARVGTEVPIHPTVPRQGVHRVKDMRAEGQEVLLTYDDDMVEVFTRESARPRYMPREKLKAIAKAKAKASEARAKASKEVQEQRRRQAQAPPPKEPKQAPTGGVTDGGGVT